MKKSDVFQLIVSGIAAVNPALGAAVKGGAAGIGALIKRDDDPTNDVDETAEALTDIVMNTVVGIENITSKDYINNPLLAQLAENIKGDLKLAQLLIIKTRPPT